MSCLQRKLHFLFIVFISISAGCASDAPQLKQGFYLPVPLYAQMVETSEDNWQFKTISSKQLTGDGVVVLFSNDQPVSENTDHKDCNYSWFSSEIKDEKRCPDDAFRSNTPSAANIFVIPLAIPFTLGYSLISGLALMDSDFDWVAYSDALTAAKADAGLSDQNIVALSESFARLDNLQKNVRDSCARYGTLKAQYESSHKNQLGGFIRERLVSQDNSGFGGVLELPNLWSQVRYSAEVASHEQYTSGCGLKTPMYPSVPSEYANAKSELQALISTEDANLSRLIEGLSVYEQRLKSGGEFIVTCAGSRTPSQEGLFYFTSSCPETIRFNESALLGDTPLNFFFQSRDFPFLIPGLYRNGDATVDIVLAGDNLTVNNNSNQYIKLEAISLYYNDQILTNGSESVPVGEMAPSSRREFQLSKFFSLKDLPARFNQLTMAKAEQQKIVFGITTKYRVVDTNVARTLHKPMAYTLASMIKK